MKYLPFLLRALMFAPDTGGGSGGSGGDDATDTDTGTGDGGDGDAGDDGDDDDDPVSLKAKLAAQREEAAKLRALAAKHEGRAKANYAAVRELEELKRKGMSADEAAIDKAVAAAKAELAKEHGAEVVGERLRGELRGRVTDDQRDALLEGLDLSRFLDDDHRPDADKVSAWVERVAPKSDKDAAGNGKRTPDLGQGRRQSGTKPTVQSGADAYAARHPKKSNA